MKTIAFDLGNVVFNVNDNEFYNHLRYLKNTGCRPYTSKEEEKRIIKKYTNLNYCGLISIYDVLLDDFKIQEEDIKDVLKAWSIGVDPEESMISFLKSLKEEDVKIAFLSNIGFEHLNDLRKMFPEIMDLADVQWMSCEVGIAKPRTLYYQNFILKYPEFKGCLYLDDKKENIIASKELGFNAIQFDLDDFSTEKRLNDRLKHIKEKL